jgi:hypothetical protein
LLSKYHGDSNNNIEGDLKAAGQTETIKRAGVNAAKETMQDLRQLQNDQGDLGGPKDGYN